jgi:hypothetical protein
MNGARFASGRELELRVVLREKGYNLSRSKKPFPPALLPFQHRILYRADLPSRVRCGQKSAPLKKDTVELLAKFTYSVIPANPGSGSASHQF